MKLTGKTILIISPQQWDGLKLSKHHYAEELSRLGNTVYFLSQPDKNITGIKIEATESKVKVVKHGHIFPYNLFFHSKKIYFFLLKKHIKKIIQHIDKIDIVWSFDSLRFLDLNLFNADLKIYHPVDDQLDKYFLKPTNSADIIFSVTDNILQKFPSFNNKHKISHGVSKSFLDIYDKNYTSGRTLNFCYAGNLTMHGVDFKAIIKIITANQNISFHFIGPYNETNEENKKYISFLKSNKNVKLYGLVTPKKMQVFFKKMDGFLLCYDPKKEQNGGTNSHKILEYLSTGKVIVSSPIVEYFSTTGLLEMSTKTSFNDVFLNVVNKIDEFNSKQNMLIRHNYAQHNTYRNQILKIESHITQLSFSAHKTKVKIH